MKDTEDGSYILSYSLVKYSPFKFFPLDHRRKEGML